jgi:hypothetical protein
MCPRQDDLLVSNGVTSSHILITKECVLNSIRSVRDISDVGWMVNVTSHCGLCRSKRILSKGRYLGMSSRRLRERLEVKQMFR